MNNQEQRGPVVPVGCEVCPGCAVRIEGPFAYFIFGSVVELTLLEEKGLDDNILEGFCHLGYHGSKSDMSDSADFAVAESAVRGQMDVHFCSIACMKKWFCDIADFLETQLANNAGDSAKDDTVK
jgi:hypothetical protein